MGLVAVGGGAGTISRKALVRCFDMFALHRSGASRVSMARPDMPLKHDRAPFEEGALLAASDDAGVRLATDRPPGEGEGACRRGVPDSRSTGAAPPERTVPGRTVPAGIVDGAPVGPFSSRSQGRRVSPALPGVQPQTAGAPNGGSNPQQISSGASPGHSDFQGRSSLRPSRRQVRRLRPEARKTITERVRGAAGGAIRLQESSPILCNRTSVRLQLVTANLTQLLARGGITCGAALPEGTDDAIRRGESG